MTEKTNFVLKYTNLEEEFEDTKWFNSNYSATIVTTRPFSLNFSATRIKYIMHKVKDYTRGATSGTGTAYPFGVHPRILVGFVLLDL
jgi:hypothetical protein